MISYPADATRKHSRHAQNAPWALVAALAISLLIHVALSFVRVNLGTDDDAQAPLAVSITELPPPPVPVATAPVPRAKPKPRPRPTPVEPAATVASAEPEAPAPEAAAAAATPAPADSVPTPPAIEEAPPVAAAPPTPPPRELPPRIDLAYRAFLGTHGFLIGDAVYRLQHTGNQYSIATVAEARGLVSLFYRGQAKARSEGVITGTGLKPYTYSIERTNSARREAATFDWDNGMVQMGENALPLELPTFDPLVVLWQFYFAPPEQDEAHFNIATTRKIYHYSFRRVGSEKVTLPFGDVDTDVWTQDGGDGSISAKIWLAPSLHFVAVKVQLSNDHATIETLLDSIRVDDAVAQQ